MAIYRLGPEPRFPDPEQADASGLLAVGGDLGAERLLRAYTLGIFPWYEAGQPILWHSPDPRAVLEPRNLHVPRRLERTLRRGAFEVRFDGAFARVVRACAEVPRRGQDGTWITDEMREAYTRLHDLGFAHSSEAWQGGELVGGVYGVSLGSCFFGESMFSSRRDASKVALVWLVRQLAAWGFELVDCQMYSDHLARFGVRAWPRRRFLAALARALERPTRRGRWQLELAPRPGG